MTPQRQPLGAGLFALGIVLSALSQPSLEAATLFRRGDVDVDGRINITDPLRTLGTLFLGAARLPCEDAADVDDSGALDVSDATSLLNFLFLAGPAPVLPGPRECGADTTADDLACASYLPELEGARCPESTVSMDKLFTPEVIPIHREIVAVELGHVNADGHLDGVVVGVRASGVSSVTLLLGNERGELTKEKEYLGLAAGAQAGAVGDLDGNGTLDILVAGQSGVLSVLRGVGDGTFDAEREPGLADPSPAAAVALADVDNDGLLDVLLAQSGTESGIAIRLGLGDASFFPPLLVDWSPSPADLAVADIDRDGALDVVAAGARLGLLLGRGDGTFLTPFEVGDETHGQPLAVGDFDGDGMVDIAAGADRTSPRRPYAPAVALFLGTGDGFFLDLGLSLPMPHTTELLVAGDITGDGHLDLISGWRGDLLFVLPGQGDGTFGSGFSVYPVAGPQRPGVLALGDLDSDGTLDVVTAGETFVSVLRGSVDQGAEEMPFDGTVHLDVGAGVAGVAALAVSDLNDDGVPDVAAAGWGAPLGFFLGSGDGTFSASSSFGPSGDYNDIELADLNGDGTLDVVAANWGDWDLPDGSLDVTLRGGDGSFTEPVRYWTGNVTGYVAVGDVDDDGALDLGAGNRTAVVIFRNRGDGSFEDSEGFERTHRLGGVLQGLVGGDFNGDGATDFAAVQASSNVVEAGSVHVLVGRGDASFERPVSYAVRLGPTAIIAEDLDGDSILDLVFPRWGTGTTQSTMGLLKGRGDGTFVNTENFRVGVGPRSVAAGDLDGDGDPDLIASHSEGEFVLFENLQNGRFETAARYLGGAMAQEIRFFDFDLDGDLDLLATTVLGVGVLVNQRCR